MMRQDLDALAQLAAEAFLHANRAECAEERRAARARGRDYADRIRAMLRNQHVFAEAA